MKTPTPAQDVFLAAKSQIAEAFNSIIAQIANKAREEAQAGNLDEALVAAAIAGEVRSQSIIVLDSLQGLCEAADQFFAVFPEEAIRED